MFEMFSSAVEIQCKSTLLPLPSHDVEKVSAVLTQARSAQVALFGRGSTGSTSEINEVAGYVRQPMPRLSLHSADRTDSGEVIEFRFADRRPSRNPTHVGVIANNERVLVGPLVQMGSQPARDGVARIVFLRGALRMMISGV